MNHSNQTDVKIGFIGAGKVGCTLGRFFAEHGASVTAYASRSLKSAEEAAALTGAVACRDPQELLSACGMVFLTVPDGAITQVYRQIASESPQLLEGKLLYHCSGALAARDAFPESEKYGAKTASVHPIFPVSNKETVWRELKSAYFCLEGDEGAVSAAETLLARCAVKFQRINPADKTKYHAGCVFASNLVCALMQESFRLLEDCGFTQEGARAALSPLIRSNLDHVLSDGAVQALTGPVERCDAGTVEKHLTVLDGEAEALYRASSLVLTQIAQEKHPETDYTGLRNLLEEET